MLWTDGFNLVSQGSQIKLKNLMNVTQRFSLETWLTDRVVQVGIDKNSEATRKDQKTFKVLSWSYIGF